MNNKTKLISETEIGERIVGFHALNGSPVLFTNPEGVWIVVAIDTGYQHRVRARPDTGTRRDVHEFPLELGSSVILAAR